MTPKYLARNPNEELCKMFKLFAIDENGLITFNQMKRVCRELGEQLSDDEIREMIHEAD